ncbi:four-carbon acid sugar kinase family protein [Comamonas sp. MYb69]|uniref:four-carbon acid sugar kinase family protein n=1 Tax=Comamonas sp. MYb69 TaxID=1848650 RepID=UPI0030A3B9F3
MLDTLLRGKPAVVWYGDDFTGATDTLATVAQAGLRSLLFLDVPTEAQRAQAGPLQAIGIAGAARSLPPAVMAEVLTPVAQFMAASGAPLLHYKCCSTFDSAPHVGSIGAAVAALRKVAPASPAVIVGGQPNIGRFCAFGNLFAQAGPGGAVHRIDRHPTMRQHPVTPMDEADLRLHLAKQGLADIRLLSTRQLELAGADADVLLHWMQAQEGASPVPDALLIDLVHEAQLPQIGALLWARAQQSPLLAVGPSGVEQCLIAGWRQLGLLGALPVAEPLAPAQGPVLVLVGSLSPVSSQQIAASQQFDKREVEVDRLLAEEGYLSACAVQLAQGLHEGRPMLAHTSRPDQVVDAATTAAVAQRSAQLVAETLRLVAAQGQPLRRLGIAGGDTSSLATQALGLWGLAFHSTLAPGVTLSVARSDDARIDGLELMLKGGQMGDAQLFDRLVTGAG